MATKLTIKREGSLLSTIEYEDLTDTQILAVQAVLEDELLAEHVNDTVLVRDAERYVLDGIAQYQAESR